MSDGFRDGAREFSPLEGGLEGGLEAGRDGGFEVLPLRGWILSKLLSDRSRGTSLFSLVGVFFPVLENMRVRRAAMVAFVGLPAGDNAGAGRASPFAWAARFMPARARVTEASPSRGSYECCEAAAEETAEGTGEGEGGVMCGGSTGEDWKNEGWDVKFSVPRLEDERLQLARSCGGSRRS